MTVFRENSWSVLVSYDQFWSRPAIAVSCWYTGARPMLKLTGLMVAVYLVPVIPSMLGTSGAVMPLLNGSPLVGAMLLNPSGLSWSATPKRRYPGSGSSVWYSTMSMGVVSRWSSWT